MVLPRLSESERADSKRTFCHSSWRAACSEGIGPQVQRDIHRRAGRHQLLQEPGRERARPLNQVQSAGEAISEPNVALVEHHLNRLRLVALGRRAAQGRSNHEALQGLALKRVDAEAGAGQQAAKFRRVLLLADRVEAAVQDALARLQLGQEPALGLGGRPGLLGQVAGLGLLQLAPHAPELRRMLADQQLQRKIAGVEQPGEGAQLGRVQLQAHQLGHGELDPIEADGTVHIEVREHEAERQLGQFAGGYVLLRRRFKRGGVTFYSGRRRWIDSG